MRLVYELHFQLVHRELVTSSPWLKVLSVRKHYLRVAGLVVIGCAPEMILPDQWLYSWVCDSGIIHGVMDQISVISTRIFCSLCERLAFSISLIAFQIGITSSPLGTMFHYLRFLPPFLPPVHAHPVSCLQTFKMCFLIRGDEHVGISWGAT